MTTILINTGGRWFMRNEKEKENEENESEDTTTSYQVTFLSRPVIQVSPDIYRYISTRLER